MRNRNPLAHTLRQVDRHIQSGRARQAIQRLTGILKLLPQHPQANSQLRTLLLAQRQHALLALYQSGRDVITSEIAARFFINDYPDHPLGWQVLGAILHDSGQLAEALDINQQTTARFPNDANTHNNLAHTLLALQRYDEALVSARAALKINPALAQARAHECRRRSETGSN